MSDWKPTNPVEHRFALAHEDWLKFAKKKQARLLYWYADDSNRDMIQIYLQTQAESDCSVIVFEQPFLDSETTYLHNLSAALIHFYDERRQGSLQQGISANWQAPVYKNQPEPDYFFYLADNLSNYHPDIFPGFVFVLQPTYIENRQKFEQTLIQLVQHATFDSAKTAIRIIVVGDDPQSVAQLKGKYPIYVELHQAEYKMQQLPREIIADSTERGDSAQFRRLYVMLGETLHSNNFVQLEQIKTSALAISNKKNWFDQSTVIFLTTGAAYLKVNKPKLALDEYQQATSSALKALESEHPAGNKLVANALFGEASVYLTQKEYTKAAHCYAKAAYYTQADKDGILSVEAWRMNAWCLDKSGQNQPALQAALKGLDAGLLIPKSTRANCGLPILVQWIVERLSIFSLQQAEIKQKLTLLYGENWLKGIRKKSPEAVTQSIAQEEIDKQEAQNGNAGE